ncbi:MAG: hypothetical protein GTO18_11050 [Anaerolineales bacterium]|nr:hypothetical protein [Anaerolineales bacterium]
MDAINSVVYVPERELLRDCKLLRYVANILPSARRAFSGPPFEVALELMTRMEDVVEKAIDPDTGLPYAKMATSLKELDESLDQDGGSQIAFTHSVEGANSLGKNGSEIENLERLFHRGVATLTLAHFYDNGIAPPRISFS